MHIYTGLHREHAQIGVSTATAGVRSHQCISACCMQACSTLRSPRFLACISPCFLMLCCPAACKAVSTRALLLASPRACCSHKRSQQAASTQAACSPNVADFANICRGAHQGSILPRKAVEAALPGCRACWWLDYLYTCLITSVLPSWALGVTGRTLKAACQSFL